jgi:hypothetical protein
VRRGWGLQRAYLQVNSSAHKALVSWLASHITSAKMQYYIRARENYLSETFHSLINKYVSKRIHWRKSHYARLACAALDWNENRDRKCLSVIPRKTSNSVVRRQPAKQQVLSDKTFSWKEEVTKILFK